MKRTFVMISMGAILAIAALVHADPKAPASCSDCCKGKCGQTCCQKGCTDSCCKK